MEPVQPDLDAPPSMLELQVMSNLLSPDPSNLVSLDKESVLTQQQMGYTTKQRGDVETQRFNSLDVKMKLQQPAYTKVKTPR